MRPGGVVVTEAQPRVLLTHKHEANMDPRRGIKSLGGHGPNLSV
jgi:hypothetical protein